jgi:hypothetical protein
LNHRHKKFKDIVLRVLRNFVVARKREKEAKKEKEEKANS